MNLVLSTTLRNHGPRSWPAWWHALWPAPARPAAPTWQHLDAAATVWLRRPLGHTVHCQTGTLWLTFDGEPEDLILEAGQSHRCTKASPLAIHAFAAARVQVA
jgi:hypothetical protein